MINEYKATLSGHARGESSLIIRFLGTHNAESKNTKLVSFLIDDSLAIDAGSLASELTFEEQRNVKAILLSHGHYDHIRGVPAFALNNSNRVTKVFATRQTFEILSSHLIDGTIYPEFTSNTTYLGEATLELVPLEPFKPQNIGDYEVRAIPVNHPIAAVGFEISSKEGKQMFYTGDSGPGLSDAWRNVTPQTIIADVSVPNRLAKVAKDAGHLCPEMLKQELIEFHRIRRYLPQVVLIHLSRSMS